MTRYMFMVFAGACSYGMLSTFVKLAYREGFGPVHIAFLQAFTGMCVLWLISGLREKSPFRINVPLLGTGAAIGLTSFVYYVSVQFIPASLAIVLLMQFVWMGLLLDWLLFGQRPGGRHLLCVALILAGTWLSSGITFHQSFPAAYWKGVGLALLSAFLYAVFIVANSKTGHNLPPVRKSAVMMTGAVLAIALLNCRTLATSPLPETGILPWTAFLAFFGTILPPLLFAKGIPKIGASMSALVMSAELPMAVMCAALLLGEEVSPLQWSGVGLMLGAMALLPKTKEETATKTSTSG